METPDRVPAELRIGDTARWTRSLSDYPASAGWALAYTLVSGTAAHSFSASAAGDDFKIDVPAATTATWAAGRYQLQEYVTNGADRHTIGTTPLRLLPNLAVVGAGGADLRSHARKVLDAIEAWLDTRAPTSASFQVAGRTLSNYPLPELLTLRDRYRAEVLREDRLASGHGAGKLLARF